MVLHFTYVFRIWKKEKTCIPVNMKTKSQQNYYELNFTHFKYPEIKCKLIGIPSGDWMILNLLAKGNNTECKAKSLNVVVSKYVNVHGQQLNKFWNLKELALR